ncbi:uncharacterized protein LOC117563898 [Drosophila albomicans]|uniref:Uncharacterized protein LOC117563898 n=1 Tax=Drosophila albomicans TaxID=7291 RepID=A0A6P8WKM8_DROAB|nr:uncharacterized protein LOC117563898 [Drosophila albomicans]
MNPKGPYFQAPCQRDRFPSLVDEMGEDGDKLVAHLGIANISDMGARLKRGMHHSRVSEQRAANAMIESRDPMMKIFSSNAPILRRGVDKFAQVPKFDPYATEEEQMNRGQRPNPVPAPRQAGEPPYTGHCPHCRRRGSNDVANDFQGRLYLAQAYQMHPVPMAQQQANNEALPHRHYWD